MTALQLVVVAALAISAFAPTTRLWGIHHLSYYPIAVRVTVLALVLLTFVPAISEWIYARALRTVAWLMATSQYAWVRRAGVAIAAIAVFVSFPAATRLLGDGDLQSRLWEDAAREGASLRAFLDIVLANVQQTLALGTNIVSFMVAKTSMAAGNDHPVRAILIFFALLGAVLIFAILEFLKRRAFAKDFAIVAIAAAAFSGAIQLFCGYVEVYVPMIVASSFYLMTASETLRTGKRLWLPMLILVAAIFMHAQALLLIPSVVVLALGYTYRKRDARDIRRLAIVVIAISVGGAFALRLIPATSRFFLPFFSTANAHGVISVTHVVDMVNALLLIFPMGVLVLGVALDRVFSNTDSEHNPTTDEMWRRGFHRSLATAGVLFLLLFHPDLGMANDWDLYIVATMCIAIPALRHFKNKINSVDNANAARVIVPAIALSALIAISWVGVNTSEPRSVKRYREVIASEKMSGAYGFEILANYYNDRGDIPAEIEALEKAVSISPNPRYWFTLGMRRYNLGEKERAVEMLYRCLGARPDFNDAREFLVQMLYFSGRYKEVIKTAEVGARQKPSTPLYPFFMGKAHLAEGRTSAALAAFERCHGLQMPDDMRSEVEQLLGSLRATP